jgi:phage gpG-like protein
VPAVRGLGVNDGLVQFKFKPSIGIMAARVDKLGLNIKSFREPLKRCVQKVIAPSFKKNFEAGGRPEPWAPQSEVTMDMGGSGQPLIRSTTLMKTMQQLNIWTINERAASLQDLPGSIWYGKIHQAGDPGTNTPARPFVLLQGEDYDDIEKVFSDWLQERIDRAALGRRGF